MLKEKVKDYFDFNRSQRNGIVVLAGLIILAILFHFLAPLIFTQPQVDYTNIQARIDEWNRQQAEKTTTTVANESGESELNYTENTSVELFEFNPNQLSVDQWIRLGFSPRQAEAILRYEAKGGVFRTKGDVAKLFVVSAEKFQELKPYILLPDSLPKTNSVSYTSNESEHRTAAIQLVELNTADTTELKKLKGIGSYYARKIVEYRDNLGGYHSIDQLMEIWKMKPETVESLRSLVTLNPALAKGIAVNNIGAEQLALHPYVSNTQAKALVAYREKHGPYTSIEQIQKATLMTDEEFQKFTPYIRFD